MSQENKEIASLLLQTYEDIRLMVMSVPDISYGTKILDFGIVNMNFGIRLITITSPDFILSNYSDCLHICYLDETNWTHTKPLTNYFNSIGMAYVCYCKYPDILYFLLRVKTYLKEFINDQRGKTINK